MGRSQVKYRATHGRGRGRGAGGARGRGKGRGNATDGQALGSNAFRYEDRDDNAEGEEEEEEEMVFGQTKALASGQRQFFAEEKSYRGPTGGSHFQSRTMKQWEATEDDDAIDGTFGVVDFAWLADQLAKVPPAIRYHMDPKDCVDLPFEPTVNSSPSEETSKTTDRVEPPLASSTDPARTAQSARPPAAPATSEAEALDLLLELSSSTAALSNTPQGVPPPSTDPTRPATTSSAPAASAAQLEDWLDDVLDM